MDLRQLLTTRDKEMSITTSDDRERLIRLDEQIKHMSDDLTKGLAKIEQTVDKLVAAHTTDGKDDRLRVEALEKRVDKLYVLGSAALFIGTPTISILIKIIFGKFGL